MIFVVGWISNGINWFFPNFVNGGYKNQYLSWKMRRIKFSVTEIDTGHPIKNRRSNLVLIYKKEINLLSSSFSSFEIKRGKDTWTLRKTETNQWNSEVTVIPIVDVALGMVFKDMEKTIRELDIRGRTEILQSTELLKSAKILRRFIKNQSVYLFFRLQLKTGSQSENRWKEKKGKQSQGAEKMLTVIPTVDGALGTVANGLENNLAGLKIRGNFERI